MNNPIEKEMREGETLISQESFKLTREMCWNFVSFSFAGRCIHMLLAMDANTVKDNADAGVKENLLNNYQTHNGAIFITNKIRELLNETRSAPHPDRAFVEAFMPWVEENFRLAMEQQDEDKLYAFHTLTYHLHECGELKALTHGAIATYLMKAVEDFDMFLFTLGASAVWPTLPNPTNTNDMIRAGMSRLHSNELGTHISYQAGMKMLHGPGFRLVVVDRKGENTDESGAEGGV